MAVQLHYPKIMVDGHDIAHYVRSYKLSHHVDEFPTLTVELVLPDAPSIVEDPAVAEYARVLLGDETRAALVALGWTPPAEG